MIFQFLLVLLLWSLWPCFRNHACIPKSQTMLLSFRQIVKIDFIWRLLVAYLDWMLLNKENGTSKTFFLNSWTFDNGLHREFSNCCFMSQQWFTSVSHTGSWLCYFLFWDRKWRSHPGRGGKWVRDRDRLFIFCPITSQLRVWDTDVNHCCGS